MSYLEVQCAPANAVKFCCAAASGICTSMPNFLLRLLQKGFSSIFIWLACYINVGLACLHLSILDLVLIIIVVIVIVIFSVVIKNSCWTTVSLLRGGEWGQKSRKN